jgi:amidase
MTETHPNWKEVVVRKRATREALLPKKWLVPDSNLPSEDVFDVTALCAQKGWLSDLKLEIASKTVTELSEEIKTGRLTSVQVISAFAHRATIAHQLTNWYV